MSPFNTFRNFDKAVSGNLLISSSPANTGRFLLQSVHLSYNCLSSASFSKLCLYGAAVRLPPIMRRFYASTKLLFSSGVISPLIFVIIFDLNYLILASGSVVTADDPPLFDYFLLVPYSVSCPGR